MSNDSHVREVRDHPSWKPLDQAFPDETTVRVLEGDERPRIIHDDGARLPQPKPNRAAQRQADILRDAELELTEARDLVVSALEDFGLLTQPQHPNLPTLIGQQIEQVIAYGKGFPR